MVVYLHAKHRQTTQKCCKPQNMAGNQNSTRIWAREHTGTTILKKIIDSAVFLFVNLLAKACYTCASVKLLV